MVQYVDVYTINKKYATVKNQNIIAILPDIDKILYYPQF